MFFYVDTITTDKQGLNVFLSWNAHEHFTLLVNPDVVASS